MAHAAAPSLARPAPAPAARIDAAAAIGSGLFAGALLLLLLLTCGAVLYGESPDHLLRLIASTARGPAVLGIDDDAMAPVAWLALLLHFAYASLYALALAAIVSGLPRVPPGWAGAVFGVGLYYANFHGFIAFFPWMAELRTLDTLLAHAAFGFVAAQSYAGFARR